MSRHSALRHQSTTQGSGSSSSRPEANRVMSISSVLNNTDTSNDIAHRSASAQQLDPRYNGSLPYRTPQYSPTVAAGHQEGVAYTLPQRHEPTSIGSRPTAPVVALQRQPSPLRPRRASRPKYEDEQVYFIWYWRTDLNEPWDRVLIEFWKQFSGRRSKGGLQCRFYRALDQYGVEKVRDQHRLAQKRDMVGQFGVVERTRVRYPWMRSEHLYRRDPLPQFRNDACRTLRNTPCRCEGCQHNFC